MARNEMYQGVWRGDEDPKQIDAFSWLIRNGYPVASIYDYVAEMERIEAIHAIGDIYKKLAAAGFKFGREKPTTWITDERNAI